jgi:hypothetical protein
MSPVWKQDLMGCLSCPLSPRQELWAFLASLVRLSSPTRNWPFMWMRPASHLTFWTPCGWRPDGSWWKWSADEPTSKHDHLESVIPTVPVPTPSAMVSAQVVAPPPLPQTFTTQQWLSGKQPSAQHALQRQTTKISKQIFPEKDYQGLSPNFHIHASVSDLYIPTIGLPILLEEICRTILGLYKLLTDTRMWKLGLRPHYSQKRNT